MKVKLFILFLQGIHNALSEVNTFMAEDIWKAILAANDYLNSIVWGIPMIILLVGTGLLLVFLHGFIQVRKFGTIVKTMFWRGGAKGEVHPFKMWCMVMGATVGVGNIAGVSTAVHLGGPGAVFWMWICAILGMGVKLTEVTLSLWSRRVLPDGRIRGGTMYYIEKIPKIGPPLAIFFSLMAFLCAFGIGNMTQANSVALGVEYAAKEVFGISDPGSIFNLRLAAGILMVIFTALVIIGGIKRIAEVSFYLIPFMSAWYIIFGLGIWIASGANFGRGIYTIISSAFTGTAAVGGFAGASVYMAIRYGFARGLFSNEAGLGSAPLAYAYAESDHPGRQGFYGAFEVFWDTIVICTITGVADVVTGAWETGLTSTALAAEAFRRVYGLWSPIFVSVALCLFAYTTLLTWEFYGENTFLYFIVEKCKIGSYRTASWFYRIVWLPPIIAAAVAAAYLGPIWDFADTMNGLMAIPNLIAVVILAPIAVKLAKDFYTRHIIEVGGAKPATATDGGNKEPPVLCVNHPMRDVLEKVFGAKKK